MKLSVSAYRAHAAAHKKILTSSYQQHYGSTAAPPSCNPLQPPNFTPQAEEGTTRTPDGEENDGSDNNPGSSRAISAATSREEDDDSSNNASNESKSPGQRTKSNQRWMKLRTTVQLSSAIQKKPPLKREDSFLKRFSTRQIPETQETVEDTGSEGATGEQRVSNRQRRRKVRVPRTVVNPDENFYFYWLWLITICVLYNLWTLIVRQSFPELQIMCHYFWVTCDGIGDIVFALDLVVQLRTGYLEQGLMVYDSKKLAKHYVYSRAFLLDITALLPLDLLQLKIGTNPIIRFPRFLKVYRAVNCYYIVESRTVYPNFWRVINLIHILLILAHWFGCFYFLLSEAEGFQGDWAYPHRPGDYATLTRKYLGSLYWSTLTLTTIGDLPTPETNADAHGGPKFLPRRGLKSRLLQFRSNRGYIFTIVSYLIGVFIFATIVGQVGNVITNRNANRLEFERLLDGAKTYMRHHKVPGGMKRRVLRWYDYSWSRGRIQGGGDINTALGLLPDKLKTELALHVNLSVLKKVTIFQECQPEFLHDLVLKMKAYIFTPGDSICRKGEVAREMFIIADGILEVISETGRVLTTMKAGDFFGEIGILNLDGLNKRTADVRSVGYSELFSLSREDVLAAMKDYPEAQDILQTLGRKRLQEAKSMSRQKVKSEISPDKSAGDESAPKRIVHKLRTDVKCKTPVIEKSALEIAPIQTKESREEPKSKKPWTKLKKAAILGDTKSKPSSEDKNESQNVSKDSIEGNLPEPSISICVPKINTAQLVKIDNASTEIKSDNLTQDKSKTCLSTPSEPVQQESLDLLTMSPKKCSVPNDKIAIIRSSLSKDKKYKSIDDLSPEYGGLPFVKKLKILNERQKLAELEKVMKFRSSSLDCASSSEDLLCDTLTRSMSEGSTMDKRKFKRKSIDSVESHGSNETLERRTLKSILKKLSEDVTPAESPEKSRELRKLIRAPTVEGYAMRHSKFAKSVTFHRHTLPSPPASIPMDDSDDVFELPTPAVTVQQTTPSDINKSISLETPPPQVNKQSILNAENIQPNLKHEYKLQSNFEPVYDYKSLRPEEIRVPSDKPKLSLISAVANQRKLLRGSIEEQEYFGEVLFGIKKVIQRHLYDVQGKFQERFDTLENEVRKRDEIISQLQNRIQELERLGLPGVPPNTTTEQAMQFQRNDDLKTMGQSKNSSGSDEISGVDEGFMRGDSLDTVFTTSPPEISATDIKTTTKKISSTPNLRETQSSEVLSEEKLTEMTEGIELSKLTYSELQSLAESLSKRTAKTSSSKEDWSVNKSKRLDLNLDGKAGTYSRKRAEKIRQRKSWEDQNYQETMELQDLTRPLSPHMTSENRSLLSPEQSSLRMSRRGIRPFQFLGTHLDNTKTKIKKTLSVDTGMHHTGRKDRKPLSQRPQRKFSLGSFFGYNRGAAAKMNCNDVVVDIDSDYSWSDCSSTSSSSDSESIPRTPVFEEFIESNSRSRCFSNQGQESPIRAYAGSGSHWEVMMLADELEKREREKERDENKRLQYPVGLRDLEEESDTPHREDSPDDLSNMEDSNSTTQLLSQSISEASHKSMETSFTESSTGRPHRVGSVGEQVRPTSSLLQSRGLILRAASLDRERTTPSHSRRFGGSLKSSSTDSHKNLKRL
nr:uncharacterized protein LOC113395493 [Vanessa tameamea]